MSRTLFTPVSVWLVGLLYSMDSSLSKVGLTATFEQSTCPTDFACEFFFFLRLELAALERRAAVAELLHQLVPHVGGFFLEHERRVGVAEVPVALLDLGGELARAPADEADEVTRVVRRGLDDAIDVLRVGGDEQ